MRLNTLIDAMKGANLNGVLLALKDRQLAREYWSQNVQRYSELMGHGLRAKNPVNYIYKQGWAKPSADERVHMPVALHTGGGTRLDELLVLATVARVLQPKRVFEIGTFNGRTTSVFVLNVAPHASVVSLDLPPAVDPERPGAAYLATDVELVRQRKVGSFLYELGLGERYQQLFGDSIAFDPSPYAASVELGFIDGAHTLRYVKNDTEKMAAMVSDRGLVFWHDYGGRGQFRELTEYLDGLSRQITVYRVANTSLAWCAASDLRQLAA
jgi:hypothetical protein